MTCEQSTVNATERIPLGVSNIFKVLTLFTSNIEAYVRSHYNKLVQASKEFLL